MKVNPSVLYPNSLLAALALFNRDKHKLSSSLEDVNNLKTAHYVLWGAIGAVCQAVCPFPGLESIAGLKVGQRPDLEQKSLWVSHFV